MPVNEYASLQRTLSYAGQQVSTAVERAGTALAGSVTDIAESLVGELRLSTHARMVQEVKGRLAAHQPALQRTAVSITTVAVGAALAAPRLGVVVWPALVAVLAFAGLHGYYLWLSRLYRHLYDAVVAGQVPDLAVTVAAYRCRERYWRALASTTVAGLYLPLAVLLVVVGVAA